MKLTLQQLETHLWGAANILRGKTAGQDYKNYILSLMFYKRLCDQWEYEASAPGLFSDTESGENLPEKVLRGELPGNAAERVLRESQLLREKFPAAQFAGGRLKAAARGLERAQVPLSGEKQRFAARGPSGRAKDGAAQLIQAGAGFRRYDNGCMPRGRRQEARRQVGLVENVDARGPGGHRLERL